MGNLVKSIGEWLGGTVRVSFHAEEGTAKEPAREAAAAGAGPRAEEEGREKKTAGRDKPGFACSVLDAFRTHVGRFPAETGGLLGSRDKEDVIDLCYFDDHSRNTPGTFYYDVETMTRVYRGWKEKGYTVNGIFHSHPQGCIRPSYHDVSTALLHLRFFKLDYFYMPIVQPARKGLYTVYLYVVRLKEDKVVLNLEYVVKAEKEGYSLPAFRPFREVFSIEELDRYRDMVDGRAPEKKPAVKGPGPVQIAASKVAVPLCGEAEEPAAEAPAAQPAEEAAGAEAAAEEPAAEPAEEPAPQAPAEKPGAGSQFRKVASLYPESALDKVIICVGTGGARSFLENMARGGFRNYILIDRDVVSESNVATQAVFLSEIGRKKVEVIRDRILDINPDARVLCVDRFLDDSMSDEEFRGFMDAFPGRKPTDYLILGCTDNFDAQKRSSFLALKYGTPYLAAMMYEGGAACELMFFYPGLTECCPRCMLRDRFEKYEKGFVNDVDSSACSIFATERMNATKGMLAQMILCYGEGEEGPYRDLLFEIRERTFVWIRLDPHLARTRLGIGLFDSLLTGRVSRYTFTDETLWIPQKPDTRLNAPENCRLCGGRGDLTVFMKEWARVDTRTITFTDPEGDAKTA